MPTSLGRRLLALLLALAAAAAAEDPTTGGADKPAAPKPTAKGDAAARAARKQIVADRLLQYFTIGVEAPASWHLDTQKQNGCRWATNMMYLSGGVEAGDTGDNQWFFKYGGLETQLKEAKEAGIIAWYTWYMLSQSAPSHYKPSPAPATQTNAKVPGTMRAYWEVYKRVMTTCAKYPDVPSCVQIEPDEWGHLLLGAGMDPLKTGVVLVGGSGMPELAGLPDSVAGWAAGLLKLRDLYSPRTLLCANPSAWDREGTMSGEKWAGYFKACGVTADGGWDLFVAQLMDWDRGLQSNGSSAVWPPYTEANTVVYHGSWDRMCQWIKAIHEGTGLWCSLWQLPCGNAYYCTCDGSEGHGCEGVAEQLLEDYPRNGVAQRMVAAGCCMWIFSHGGPGAAVWDAKKDGITNPKPIAGNKGKKSEWPDDDGGYLRVMGAKYFKKPVPILGKRRASAAPGAADAGGDDAAEQPAKTARTATLADADAPKAWNAKLLARIQEELAARRTLKFTYSALKTAVRIDGLDNGVMKVRLEDGAQLDLPWGALAKADLLQLALLQVRDNKPDDHAIAGFYLMLDGQLDKAEEQLDKSGDAGGAARKAFTVK